ncbi:SDR family NAD(P)-dependent oxidoreductase [Nannocystis pusilla]|uniref:SDR family NAD(P)-dependent oxidoreductase n=1 Tax=Nannocystis pusilla TaxID=889268 RepID=A0A9X3EJ96_9BACT|nr:SDR family NAD(P)-dependent oxidoreductase [Nannocystis pusilla]MCY1004254.1 SDR family NAD(P)-dependent oxidoreductase [Nannocystis pusilla]
MNTNLSGKRALVTGSTSGLGEAIAKMMAREGAHVVVHGRDAWRAEAVATAIRVDGGSATVALGDLTSDEAADAVARAAGPVDVLVNNAGAYHHASWFETTPAQWAQSLDLNVISGVRMVHRLVPAMRERGWGRVITIGGGLAIQPMPMQPDYQAALAARHNLAVSLARALAGTGVTSNVVAPGAILVPAVEQFLREIGKQRGWGSTWEEIEPTLVREMVPNDVGRLGHPDEIAAAVTFLASEHAAYMSGAVLRVDGGTIRSVA